MLLKPLRIKESANFTRTAPLHHYYQLQERSEVSFSCVCPVCPSRLLCVNLV